MAIPGTLDSLQFSGPVSIPAGASMILPTTLRSLEFLSLSLGDTLAINGTLDNLQFSGNVRLSTGASMTIAGTFDNLQFSRGVYIHTGARLAINGMISSLDFNQVMVEQSATLALSGSIALTDTAVLGYGKEPSSLLGARVFEDGVTFLLEDGTALSLNGELPGTVTAERGDVTFGSLTRTTAGEDVATTPSGWLTVFVTIKAWGGGGGGGRGDIGNDEEEGRSGSYLWAEYLVPFGDVLTLTVGGGGAGTSSCMGGSGGFPNGGSGGSGGDDCSSHPRSSAAGGGGGGGASFVCSTRDSIGMILSASGGGGGAGITGSAGGGGGGGGGTNNGVVGSGGDGGNFGADGSPGINGNGNGGCGYGGCDDRFYSNHGSNGWTNWPITSYKKAGGGGHTSNSYVANHDGVMTSDAHYDASGSGGGGDTETGGTRGRVVLIVRGEATSFDSVGEATFVVQ